MPRPNRGVAGLCIAVVVLTAFLPGICSLDYALFELQWVLLRDETPVVVERIVTSCDEQPVSFLSLLPPRAPPSLPFA